MDTKPNITYITRKIAHPTAQAPHSTPSPLLHANARTTATSGPAARRQRDFIYLPRDTPYTYTPQHHDNTHEPRTTRERQPVLAPQRPARHTIVDTRTILADALLPRPRTRHASSAARPDTQSPSPLFTVTGTPKPRDRERPLPLAVRRSDTIRTRIHTHTRCKLLKYNRRLNSNP